MIWCGTDNRRVDQIGTIDGPYAMADTLDPTPRWTRELTNLRSRIQRRRSSGAASPELIDETLDTCDGLLRDLAGQHLECERLRGAVRAETAIWEQLFDAMPGPCLLTDNAGFIRNANRAASAILNTSAKHLKNRQLIVFSEEREGFRALLRRLARGGEHVRATIAVRPRERKATRVDVIVVPLSGDGTCQWVWFLSPNSGSQQVSDESVAPETPISAASG